jgi:uncharacterized caspase-like protein
MFRRGDRTTAGIVLTLLISNGTGFAGEDQPSCRDLKAQCRVSTSSGPGDVSSLSQFYGKSYALVVGVNTYPNSKGRFQNLKYAVADAEAVAQRLKALDFEVILLTEGRATKREIVTSLERIGKNSRPTDRIVFYFAGHGDTTETAATKLQRGFILPSNYDPDSHRHTAISMDELKGISEETHAQHMLYAMDSCFSGSLLGARSGKLNPMGASLYDRLKKLTDKRAHVVITAGAKDEKALEIDGHGVFTKTLLDALSEDEEFPEKAAWKEQGFLTSFDLASFIKNRINRINSDQQPQYGLLEGSSEVVLALYKPTEPSQPITPPAAMNQDDIQRRIREAEDRARREAEDRARQEAALKEENLRRQFEQERLQRERAEQDRIRREQDLARREAEAREREREQTRRAQEERDRQARERARAAEREKSRSNEDIFVPPSF